MKYIVVVGSVVSGVGKGVVASSTGALLRAYGKNVTVIKIDPYLNVDAGSINPLDHGEVFVLADGSEVDLDFGNYERFLDVNLTNEHSITSGKVYRDVLNKEKRNEYGGKTIQMIPHVTELVIEKIEKISRKKIISGDPSLNLMIEPEICIIELGGTIGDLEGYIYVEALRSLRKRIGKNDMVLINVEYVPTLENNEQKTKPMQNGVKQMKMLGLNPDLFVCRCDHKLEKWVKEKIATFCEVKHEYIFDLPKVSSVYEVPQYLNENNFLEVIFEKLDMKNYNKIEKYNQFDYLFKGLSNSQFRIAIVGKYIKHKDSYISIENALRFSAELLGYKLIVDWVEAFDLEKGCENAMNKLKSADGILIPGGFGTRGMEGKMMAAQHARVNNIPFLGICLGFQVAVIEFCRNVLGLKGATSEEFNEVSKYIIIEKIDKTEGNIMRGGDYKSVFIKECKTKEIYGKKDAIVERHRHRYMVNNDYMQEIEKNGLVFVAKDEANKIAEIFELENHTFFVGTQFHPEFNARPNKPHLLFNEFVTAAHEFKIGGKRPFY